MPRPNPLISVRGVAMVMILVLLGVVATVAGSLVLRTQRGLQARTDQERESAAEDVAYSGLQAGLAGVIVNGDLWIPAPAATALPQRSHLSYRLTANNNLTGTIAAVDPDGTEVPPKSIYLKSYGYVDGKATAGYSAIVTQQRGIAFNYPVFGGDSITMVGSTTEALDDDGSVIAKDAPIRTNSISGSAVNLQGGSFVDGSITVGPGGDPAAGVVADPTSGFSGDPEIAGAALTLPDSPATYTGALSPPPFVLDIPLPIPIFGFGVVFINMAIIIIDPGAYDEIVIGPGPGAGSPQLIAIAQATFTGGEYYCHSLRVVAEQNVISTLGASKVHVRDEIDFNGLLTNLAGSPGELQLYATEPTGTVSIANTSGDLVVAAQGDVVVSNSQITGAVYGRAVSLNNTTLAFPRELDGKLLNDALEGGWRLFGIRVMNPSEVAAAP